MIWGASKGAKIEKRKKHLQLIMDGLLVFTKRRLDGFSRLGGGALDGLSGGRGLFGHFRLLVLFSLLGLTGLNVVRTVLLDEVGEVLNGAGAAVLNRGVLGTSREQLDGRETLDLDGDVVGGGVNLGDGHQLGELSGGVQSGEFLVLGGEANKYVRIWELVSKF
jgi:hypothetical protein